MQSDEAFEVPFDSNANSADEVYVDVDSDQWEETESAEMPSQDSTGSNSQPSSPPPSPAGDAAWQESAADHGRSDDGKSAGDIDAIDRHELDAAREAFVSNRTDTDSVEFEDDERAVAAAEPFIGQWNGLVSHTNWEKGRIICQWREELAQLGSSPIQYSDQAWVRRVGGVTAPHVGRLRRVFERFSETYETFSGLYWSHFLAALDWDDAALWLEGAVAEKWSVSAMRNQRWESLGAVASQRPTSSQIVEVDVDEDVVLPAQGGGKSKEYDNDGSGAAAGPKYEEPDFGDSDELVSLAGSETGNSPSGIAADGMIDGPAASPSPFKDLPDLPDDLADAIETLKLAVLRHKTAGWETVDAETVDRYLKAVSILLA